MEDGRRGATNEVVGGDTGGAMIAQMSSEAALAVGGAFFYYGVKLTTLRHQ